MLDALRTRLAALFAERLEGVILFGSRARGEADPDSDVDVMVVLRDAPSNDGSDRNACMDVAAELSLRFETVILPFLTDAHTMARSDVSIYRNVRREGVAI